MLGISAAKVGRAAKAYFTSDTVKGQSLFGIPKFILSMFGSDLGNKIGFTLGGAILGIVNEMYNNNPRWKPIFRHGLANWMTTWSDPSANQIRSMTRSVKDLVNQVKMGNYSGAFGTFLEEPDEVVGAIKEAVGSAKMGGGSLGRKLGLGGGNYRDVSSVRSAEELTEVYQGEEDISPDFLQTY